MSEERWRQAQRYSRNKCNGEIEALRKKRDKARNALNEERQARGLALILDPLDSRFDEIEVEHFKAVLRICLAAWFEAYEVKGLTPDERIWKELCSFKEQTLGGRKMSFLQTAMGRANRTGRNSAHGVARAVALGQELERSLHSFMKILHCEVEARIAMKRSYGFQMEERITR